VLTIYDAGGKLIRAYELKDLFQDAEIGSFRHSESSIWWRTGPLYGREDQKTLLVTVKPGVDFLFGMETGRYKYCEFGKMSEKTSHRCRTANQPRRWTTNAEAPLER
jgi:hypothetical protein